MTKVLATFVLPVALTIIRRYFIHYFDSKKIDAYSFYSLTALYCMAIVLIYSYYIFLIVEKISKFRYLTFIVSDILFGMFILGICTSLCTAMNSFTLFRNKENELFEKKVKTAIFSKT
ncbi:hypothetical protein [Staphylococcus gallinarum]|uniref:hypothetical protein n=1 Tax=Staphylococcus gallinarum TaxID=1293 RepID=UPI00316E9467